MKAHYLQHVPFEGLGSIELWLEKKDYEITSTKLYLNEKLPELQDIDLLIVMGGSMSVHDEEEFSWLKEEKVFIKEAIKHHIPTLGICLGAQLIAHSLGGIVSPNPQKEIGWWTIERVQSSNNNLFSFPENIEVFHWHGETFSLPLNGVPLAKSIACTNQAFQIGSNIIGLQFHLETTPASARAIVENCKEELVKGQFIQSEEMILNRSKKQYQTINTLMEEILEYLTKSWVR